MSSTRRLLRIILNLAAMAATALPLAVALASLSRSDHPWPDLANQFVAPALVATGLWAALLLVLRLRVPAMLAAVTTALLLWAVWPQWFPAHGRPDPASSELTVYSANLWALNTDVDAMAASIANADADVVLLVEVGDAPAADLDRLLPHHPYRVVSAVGNRAVAPARALVASRWPLRRMPDHSKGRLFSASAQIDTPLGRTGFMAAHLTRPWPYREPRHQLDQIAELPRLRSELGNSIIVAGDFNTVSSGRVGRQIMSDTALLPAPARLGTWPADLPALFGIAIDQVWHSPDLVVVERRLGQATGSDHRPVVTRFVRASPGR